MPNDPFFGWLSLNLMGQYLQNNGHVDSILYIYMYNKMIRGCSKNGTVISICWKGKPMCIPVTEWLESYVNTSGYQQGSELPLTNLDTRPICKHKILKCPRLETSQNCQLENPYFDAFFYLWHLKLA
jgi:hypothetical protein